MGKWANNNKIRLRKGPYMKVYSGSNKMLYNSSCIKISNNTIYIYDKFHKLVAAIPSEHASIIFNVEEL